MSPTLSIRDNVPTSSFLLCLWTTRQFFDFFHIIAIHMNKEGLFKTTKRQVTRKQDVVHLSGMRATDRLTAVDQQFVVVCFQCINNTGGDNGSKSQRPWFRECWSYLSPGKHQLLPTTRTSIRDAHVIMPLGASSSSSLFPSTDAVWLHFQSGSTFVSLAASSSLNLDWA